MDFKKNELAIAVFHQNNMQELSTTSITRPGKDENDDRGYLYYFFAVDADYVPTMNMTFLAEKRSASGKFWEPPLPRLSDCFQWILPTR